MKACESCENCAPDPDIGRVIIGRDYHQLSFMRRFLGVLLVYVPLLTSPFILWSAYVTYWHLRAMGAKNLRTFSSYIPERKSYRYHLANQIIMQPGYAASPTQSRWFWIFNCTGYCPYSVALLEWHAYLVKVVENWWCPFKHDKKEVNYQAGRIDQSFWHIYPEKTVGKLDPEDWNNPMWNAHPSDQNEPAHDQQREPLPGQQPEGK
jgi:hypothetical protein